MSSPWVTVAVSRTPVSRPSLQHGHPIGDLEDLRHAMRDVDDGDALRRQAPDDLEQVPPLFDGERGGRLIENEQLQLMGETLGDLHHLLLARREVRHGGSRVDVDFKFGQNAPRLLIHRRPPNDPQEVDRLTACEDIFGNAEGINQAALLIHHSDAGIGGTLFVEISQSMRHPVQCCRCRAGRRRRPDASASTCRRHFPRSGP